MTTSESSFLVSDEPESINFQDSLRFFRQQLGNDDTSSDEYRSEDGHYRSEDGHYRSEDGPCSISIPTVDSILESVRVLRAIQKNQIREKSNTDRNSVRLDAEKYSKTTPAVGKLLFKADGILTNRLQPTDSNSYENNFGSGIFMGDILNNSHGNFWPKNAVEAQESSCSKNNINLKCYTSHKSDAISNQVGHLGKITENNNNVSKSLNGVEDAQSVLNNLNYSRSRDLIDETLSVSKETRNIGCSYDDASDLDCFQTECVVDEYETSPNEDLFEGDSTYYGTSQTPSGYTSSVLSSPTEIQRESGVVLIPDEFSQPDPHQFSHFEVYRNQIEDPRCRLPTIHEQPAGDLEGIFKEVTLEDERALHSRQQKNDKEEECVLASTDDDEIDNEAPSQSSLKDNLAAEIVNNLRNKNCANEVTENAQSDSGNVNSNGSSQLLRTKKLTTSSWDLVSIVKLLYAVEDLKYPKMLCEEKRDVFVLSKGVFSHLLEGVYTLLFKERTLFILDEKGVCLVLPLANAEIRLEKEFSLVLDNKMDECLYLKCESEEELNILSNLFKSSSECIDLMHNSLKTHQNVVIIDLGSCSTRAGILMDQPTLPTLFFPSVCAVNKTTGKHVYGVEALEPNERQNSTISFPLRPSAKITKHSVDVDQVTGIFKKIFKDLRIDPKRYTVLVCLPRNLSIIVQNAIVKVLLEKLNVKAVSLSHQAILTMYAHNVSTGIVLDIGDRMDILPVIDGFIVEGGVTRLPYGGQRLIHHMKHALAEKHISLSNDLESFVVQYISERSLYVAEDFEKESSLPHQTLRKVVDLKSFAGSCLKSAALDDARFKVPEGLFKPSLWGLDSPGVHHLVQKAIQTAGVDARKKVAENIYLSGGVTLIPGFVERLLKEVTKLNEPRITPQVHASNYRYHCTFIGACKFATMDAFSQVCLTQKEYSKNGQESLKKFLLCV